MLLCSLLPILFRLSFIKWAFRPFYFQVQELDSANAALAKAKSQLQDETRVRLIKNCFVN